MRSLIKIDKVPVKEDALVPKIFKMQTREEAEMIETARRLGYAVMPVDKLRRELAQSIASRMVNRTGEFVYQSAAFSITNFPLTVLQTVFPDYLLTTDTRETKTWTLPSVSACATILGPLISDITMCAGASRALKTASERWSRVIATIYDLEISSVKSGATRVDQTFINFLYVLMDEDGEMHKPKNGKRVELLLLPAVETEIRQQVLSDAIAMESIGVPLSAGWLTSMGKTAEAAWVVALQKNTLASASSSVGGEKKRKKPRSEHYFEVAKIVEERGGGKNTEYLVQWAGYEPEWEPLRITGQVGDPLESWEPLAFVKNTEALWRWRCEE